MLIILKQLSLFILTLNLAFLVQGQDQTILSGQISNLKSDSLKIVLQVNPVIRQRISFFVPVVEGKFETHLNITKPTYLYITDGVNYVNGLIEPGDQIVIGYDAESIASSLNFRGKGKEKFIFLNDFIKFSLSRRLKQQVVIAKTTRLPFDHMFKFIDSVNTVFLTKLNSIKPSMTVETLNLLKSDLKGSIMANKYRSVGMIYHESEVETLQKRQNELSPQSKKNLQNILKFDKQDAYSPTYINETFSILFMHYDGLVLNKRASSNLIEKYRYISHLLPDNLRVPVLTLFLEQDIEKAPEEDIQAVINQTFALQDSVYKNYIRTRYTDVTSFKKGMNAPDFVLENEQGEKVTLSSFKGKVVYLDFWYAACGPCHALMSMVKPAKEYFSDNSNVAFLYISIDRKDVWKNALTKYNIKGYHVFTENKESKHPVIDAYKVAGYPTTFLIDKNGNIFNSKPSNSAEELKLQIAEALQVK